MRVVFASLGSLGDLHPLLALARGAAGRRHAPVIAASKGYRAYVESAGFEFRPIRPDFEFEPHLVGRLFHPRSGPKRLMREQIFPNVRQTYADLLAATEDADLLVVGELLYVAPLVAGTRGIPWVNAILAPTSFLSAHDPCVLAPAPLLYGLRRLGRWPYQIIFALGRRLTSRWGEPLNELRRELSLPRAPSAVFDAKHSPYLTLALFPDFFAARQEDWPPRTLQTGFPFFAQSIRPETEARLNEFLSAGEAPVVFTLGSSVVQIARDFYSCAMDAVRRLNRRAILLTGGNPLPEDPPPSVLALDYAPLDRVLPGAAALVHQGGIGTCAEALRWGVPSLVVPFGFDQPDNAERLRRLGVAAVLPRGRVSPGRLASALDRVLRSAAMREQGKEWAEKLHPERELARSLDALERVTLSGRRTPESAWS